MVDFLEIKSFINKSEEKLNSAKVDLKEKFYDDAVSRSYYAVFHIITALLFTKQLFYSSHAQTIGMFNKEFIHTKIFPQDFSKKIEILFSLRQIGDYDIKKYIDKDQAEMSISYAEEIIFKCKEYLLKLYS